MMNANYGTVGKTGSIQQEHEEWANSRLRACLYFTSGLSAFVGLAIFLFLRKTLQPAISYSLGGASLALFFCTACYVVYKDRSTYPYMDQTTSRCCRC